jgi:hypothetical protein
MSGLGVDLRHSQTANFGQLRKFKLDDGMSDSECDQPFVLSRVAAVADD